MKQLISIMGTFSVGKTTLFDYIKTEYSKLNYIQEYAKEFLVDNNVDLARMEMKDRLLFQKIMMDTKAAGYADSKINNIEDTSFLCNIAYWTYLDDNLSVDDMLDEYYDKMYKDMFDCICIVYILPVIPLEEESFRISDDIYRMEINELQRNILEKVKIQYGVEVIYIDTDIFEERIVLINDIISKRLLEEPCQ